MPLTYNEIYRNLDGLAALGTATITPLTKQKDEKDTAFVKRIVATYMMLHPANQNEREHHGIRTSSESDHSGR